MVKYNRTIFKTSHNSYSGNLCGEKGAICNQLDNGILGIELDIYGLRNFKIGHRSPGHEVDIKSNETGKEYSLRCWLELIKRYSDYQPKHFPITLFLDIRLIIEHSSYYEIDNLNAIIKDVFRDTLFTPKSLQNDNWPDLDSLKGKILIVLTGEKGVKWRYIKKIKRSERNCFISFAYQLDGLGRRGKGKELLENAHFINVRIKDWKWANEQFEQGKIIRIFYFDKIFKLKSYLGCKKIKCNFPATDYPYDKKYEQFLELMAENHAELELLHL